MSFSQLERGGLTFFTADTLSAAPGAVHGFSTRTGGVSQGVYASLNLRSATVCGDTQANVEENYRRLCAALGADASRAVLARQVHSDHIRRVTEADAGKGLWRQRDYDADALITDVPRLPLVVFSADCIITLLYDPATRSVGAVHAGWRGTALEILAKTVREMGRAYGARPEDIRAAIGPGIGPCCFETDEDVPRAMEAAMGKEALPFLCRRGGKWDVDLKGLNRRQLELAGLLPAHIDVSSLCTACRPDLFWSHRRMGGQRGVQGGLIALEGGRP